MENLFLKLASTMANLVVVYLLAGCTNPTVLTTPIPLPSRSLEPSPIPTFTLVRTQEPAATGQAAGSTQPPAPENPMSPGAISEENADQILQLAQWGKGVPQGLQFSPDGKQFALFTALGVFLYEAGTLNQVRFFPSESANYTAAFSPDWTVLAWGEASKFHLLRLADGEERLSFDVGQGRITGLNFLFGADLMALMVQPPGAEVYTNLIELHSLADGALQKTWDLQGTGWAFSPDGELLASWSDQADLQLWQLPGGEPLPFAGQVQVPASVSFSPDGALLVTTSRAEPGLRLWQVPGGAELRRLGSDSGITGVAFSPDGRTLAASDETGAVHQWDLVAGQQLQTFPSTTGWKKALSFSPDATTLALESNQGIEFMQVSDGSITQELSGYFGPIRQMAFFSNRQLLAALAGENSERGDVLRLWHMSESAPYLATDGVPALSIAFTPAGDRLALGMWNGTIQILESSTGTLLQTLTGHPAQIQDIAYSPDASLLASSSMEEIRVWQVDSGSLQRTIPVPGGWVNRIAVSPDGSLVAARSEDGAVRVWHTADGSLLNHLAGAPAGRDGDLAFSPDGSSLALAAGPSVMHWKVQGGEALSTQAVSPFIPGVAAVTLAFAPGGDLLAVGLDDGGIELWKIGEKEPLETLEGHTAAITGLSFSSEGLFLASSSLDGTLRLWGGTGAR